MERSEPALVPEWLRCSGSVAGGSTSSQHSLLSSLNSDDSSLSARSRPSRNSYDRDPQRPSFLDRSSSSNSRRTSGSNGSDKHPYSNFTRNNRDRNREKVKDRSMVGELWDHDPSDLLDNILKNGMEKSSLRRSQSLAPRRTFDPRPEDTKSVVQGNQYTGNGVILGGSDLTGIKKASFDKDFPSLGAEEKVIGSGIVRVSSPILTTAVQNLSIGTSPLLGNEKWTSALAEVPAPIGTNSIMTEIASAQPNIVQPQQSAILSQSWGASNTVPGLNMAEALSQAPTRTRSTPQVPDKNQRLDELAKKQSKQLIPVKPSVPKALVSVSLEKSKQPKGAVRATDLITSRSTQQQQLQYSNNQATQARGGQIKPDGQNSAHVGKFLVLKPLRENGTLSTVKDTSSSANNSNDKVTNGQVAPLSSTALTSTNITKPSTFEKKAAALTLHARRTEKKSSFSQAQSRSDFFNLMRKKTSINSAPGLSESGAAVISPSGDATEINGEDSSALVSPQVAEKCDRPPEYGGNGHDMAQGVPSSEGQIMCNGSAYSDEEEVAFLRSLGWEENGEDEGLTEEEINAFYEEYMKTRPCLKVVKGIESIVSESQSCNSSAPGVSSDSNSATSETETTSC